MGSSQSFYPCSPSSSLLELWELDTPRSAVFVWTLDTNQTEKEKGNGRGKAKGKKSDEAFVAAVSDATVVASTVLQDAIPGQFTSNQSSLLPHQSLKSQNRSRLVCHHHQRRYSSLHHQFSFCPLQQQDRTTLNHSPPPSPPHATHEQPNNQRPPLIWTGRGTRVEPRRHSNLAAAAQAVTTTSDVATNTASSSPVAERMENEEEEDKEEGAHSSFLSNSNTRDGADDILETPDHPTLSRVMRVQPRTDADDEGCGAVESKRSFPASNVLPAPHVHFPGYAAHPSSSFTILGALHFLRLFLLRKFFSLSLPVHSYFLQSSNLFLLAPHYVGAFLFVSFLPLPHPPGHSFIFLGCFLSHFLHSVRLCPCAPYVFSSSFLFDVASATAFLRLRSLRIGLFCILFSQPLHCLP